MGHGRQQVPVCTASVNTLDTESLLNFSGDSISHVLSLVLAGGTKHILCDGPIRGLLDASPWFTSPHARFPLRLHPVHVFPIPDCAVANQSPQYDSMLSPVSSPVNYQTWGGLGNPNTLLLSRHLTQHLFACWFLIMLEV